MNKSEEKHGPVAIVFEGEKQRTVYKGKSLSSCNRLHGEIFLGWDIEAGENAIITEWKLDPSETCNVYLCIYLCNNTIFATKNISYIHSNYQQDILSCPVLINGPNNPNKNQDTLLIRQLTCLKTVMLTNEPLFVFYIKISIVPQLNRK